MPSYPRKKIVDDEEMGTYHCISRCVRRAFLCGKDAYTNHDYNHRRKWVEDLLQKNSLLFLVEVHSYAIMSNHIHLQLRTRPDKAKHLSDEEIIERWWMLSSSRSGVRLSEELKMEWLSSKEFCYKIRQRLCSLSWFMRYLVEPIARKANKEDGVTGRFWEGRFKSIKVLDDMAKLETAIYIDLNPVKAGIATKIDDSHYTSIHARIVRNISKQYTMFPPILSETGNVDPLPFFYMEEKSYIDCVKLRAEAILAQKKMAINFDKRDQFVKSCITAIGSAQTMEEEAKKKGKKWLKGIRLARSFTQ